MKTTAEQKLRRSVLGCLLWEDEHYEDGVSHAARVAALVSECPPQFVADLAIEARTNMKLRHMPLFLVSEMATINDPKYRTIVAKTLEAIIQRADELAELLAIFWKRNPATRMVLKGTHSRLKHQPLPACVKKGLAKAFQKFSEYDLQKYDRSADVTLRDVMSLCHPEPVDEAQANMWKRLQAKELKPAGTWEQKLSAGANKKETFTQLIQDKQLGALALLRNLRGMDDAGVDRTIISKAIEGMKTERVLPFRFLSAAQHAPKFEPELESSMFKCLENSPKLAGTTVLLVDVSGSMDAKVSNKSELSRIDAACALAMLLREVCDKVQIHTFSSTTVEVPARRGFALKEAIHKSQSHSSTHMGAALTAVKYGEGADRLIVISDEQTADRVNDPKIKKAYMLNVASSQNGVGYGKWTNITGWSESVLAYIQALENAE